MEKYSGLIALAILLILLVVFIKYQANHMVDEQEDEEPVARTSVQETVGTPLDLNDEDALVASIVASIDLRNETHKNVQVLSVRKVG